MLTENATTPKRDLLSELETITERKAPTANAAQNSWNFSVDEEAEVIEETKADEPTPPAKGKEGEKKVTADEIKASAETGVAAFDLVNSILFENIVKYRFKSKNKKFFTEEDLELLQDELIFINKNQLDGKEFDLRDKWDKLMDKHETKMKRIPLSTSQRERLHFAFSEYAKIKNVTLGPETILAVAVIECLISKGIDAFTD